jgi:signal peptidase I
VLLVNGEPQIEPYAHHDNAHDTRSTRMVWQCEHAVGPDRGECRPSRDNWGPLVVPDDRYLVLGDNRDDSEDSRYWGFVPRDALLGRPLFVYYSFDPHSSRSLPWITDVRWRRLGERVH